MLKRSRRAAELANDTPQIVALSLIELGVLKLVAEYQSNNPIAEHVSLRVHTAEHHRARISHKLELKGHHALLKFALEHQAELS